MLAQPLEAFLRAHTALGLAERAEAGLRQQQGKKKQVALPRLLLAVLS